MKLHFSCSALPPSANFIWRVGKGHIYKNNQYRRWVEAFANENYHHEGKLQGVKQPVRVTITAYVPHLWRRDLDNLIKPTLDALCKVTGLDDRYVIEIAARKKEGDERIEVEVEIF